MSFCARIAQKRHKLWKMVKIEKKMSKNLVFLEYFEYSSIFGAKLVHQTLNGMFSGPWRIFWHPRDPSGRIHIEYIKVLLFVFDIQEWWRPLQLFSTFSKSAVTFVDFRLKKMTYCHIWGIIFRISIRSTFQVSKYEKNSVPSGCVIFVAFSEYFNFTKVEKDS